MRNSGWSGDRLPRNRIMLIAVPLIVTMAVGLIVGIRLVSEKNATLRLSNTGQGTANSTPAAPATPASAASPSVTPSPTTAITPTPAATPTTAATNMSRVLIGPGSTANAAARRGARVLADGVLVDGPGAATAAIGNATQRTRRPRRWDGRSGQPSRRPGPAPGPVADVGLDRSPDGRMTRAGRGEQPSRAGRQPGWPSVARPARPLQLVIVTVRVVDV